jgi:hypothetical protein
MLFAIIIGISLLSCSLLNGMQQNSEQGSIQQLSRFDHNHQKIKCIKKTLWFSCILSIAWALWGIIDQYNNNINNISDNSAAQEKFLFGTASVFLHAIAIPLAKDIKRTHT